MGPPLGEAGAECRLGSPIDRVIILAVHSQVVGGVEALRCRMGRDVACAMAQCGRPGVVPVAELPGDRPDPLLADIVEGGVDRRDRRIRLGRHRQEQRCLRQRNSALGHSQELGGMGGGLC